MRRGRPRWVAREEAAQATVEMAVVVPVLIVLALISYNLMLFMAATARFDRVAPDVVAAHAVAPAGGEGASSAGTVETIAAELERAMDGYEVEVEVERVVEDGTPAGELLSLVGGLQTYRCTVRMKPWPSALSIAGVSLGAPFELSHARKVTIDPWRPGVVA